MLNGRRDKIRRGSQLLNRHVTYVRTRLTCSNHQETEASDGNVSVSFVRSLHTMQNVPQRRNHVRRHGDATSLRRGPSRST